MITGPKHVRRVCDRQLLFCSIACSMIIMLHLWFLQKILQNSPPVGAVRADPVEGVDSPHRVVGNNFVHRVSVDNGFCFLQNMLQVCVLWVIHHGSLLQMLHVPLDGISPPSCVCRLPVQNCASTNSSLSCARLLCMLLVQHVLQLGLLVLPTLHLRLHFFCFVLHPCKLWCRVTGDQGHCEWTPGNLPLFHSPAWEGTSGAAGSACTPSVAAGLAYTPSVAAGLVYTPPVTVGSACRTPLGDDSVWASAGEDCSYRAPLGEDSSCRVPAGEGCACKVPVSSNSS